MRDDMPRRMVSCVRFYMPRVGQYCWVVKLNLYFSIMELYHQTLVRPVQVLHAMTAHLLPIKPREEQEKTKQLLIAKTSSLELYTYTLVKMGQQRYEFKSFCKEDIFSNICAIDTVEYSDEDMKKDLIILSLINGKYLLFQWMPQSSRLSLRDQGYIFSNEKEVESGFCKPIPGHYISVNNEAKMVMIASASWEFKLYSQTLGIAGVRLESLLHFQQPIDNPSICFQLAKGNSDHLFYSLRASTEQGKKIMKVHRIYKNGQFFEEESIPINNPSAHMLIINEKNSFIAIGKQDITYYNNGKTNLVKLPQIRQYLQSCYFRRIAKDKKEEIFILNQYGHMMIITFDQTKPNGCIVTTVDKIFAATHIAVLQKNLYFSVSANEDNYIFYFHHNFKAENSQIKKGKEELTRQELLNPKYPTFREIQILGSFPNSRMIRDMKVANIEKSVSSQIILTGGRPGNKKGFLSILKYGLKVKQYLTVSFMNPIGAWCLKKSIADKHHSYIVFSFANRKTSSYSFENNMLSHTNQLKLEESQATIHVNKLCDGSIVQVTASKIRHIQRENFNRDINIKGRIMKAVCVSEGRQLFILLIGGFMEYYQLNSNGQLKVVNEFSLDSQANFIDYAPPDYTESKPYSRLIVIGKTNYHISIFTIEGKGLEQKKTKNIKCMIQSLAILSVQNQYQVVVGTNAGKMVKFMINKKGEETNDQEEVIVGQRTVKYSKITVMDKLNLIRITPEPTLSYNWQGQEQQCSLPLPNVDFITQIVIEGAEKNCIFLTYFDNYLRFIEIAGFGNLLQQFDKEIQFTGRKIVICENRLGILSENKEKKQEKQIWKSVFCLFNPMKNYSMQKYLQFDINEKCISVCYVPRDTGKGYLCFGCVSEYQTYPILRAQKPCIKVFSYEKDKDPLLNLLYSFVVEDIPTAMEVYLDKLLVGVGKKLILFQIYSSKLLMKAIRPSLASYLNSIAVQGQKIITSQVFNSFTVYRLNSIEKSFDYIGEDILPRFISASYILDGNYGVIAGGDKFGNFFVSKFSEKIKTQFQSGGQSKYNEFTDCNKLDSMVICNMGEVITSIQTGHLDERRPESIFYSTIDGRVGMFYPFESQELKEHSLLGKLQKELRSSTVSCATNHENFRSFYNPSKGVIDGDFCKLFENLQENEKDKISHALQTDPKDISLLLYAMQNKFK